MPIRTRLRRMWRWAASLLHLTTAADTSTAPSHHKSPTLPPRRPQPSATRRIGTAARAGGEVVLGGSVEIRMWTVGGVVVLATSIQEAEGALVTLLSHDEPSVRRAAAGMLERIHREVAIAA
jgi:hypothetical protein